MPLFLLSLLTMISCRGINKIPYKDSLPVAAQNEIVPVNLKRIARVTGAALKKDNCPSPNNTAVRYNVGGTDLGIAWDMGKGIKGLFFGDTYGRDFVPGTGGPGNATGWRSNVLAFSTDENLQDGLSFSGMLPDKGQEAKEVIASRHDANCKGDRTMIPTAAIHAGNADFVHCMNINCWGAPGYWTTNYSALFKSADQGRTWSKCRVLFSPASKFGQAAFAKKDGWVYLFGTPPGRHGAIYLARVREQEMEIPERYEYWNGIKGWVSGGEEQARKVIDAPAGELSVTYNTKFRRWIATYLDVSKKAIVLRDAPQVTGPWSAPKIVVRSSEYPGLYGSFIYPVANNEAQLFFLMSIWNDYNVFLMRVDLKPASALPGRKSAF